MRNRLIDEVYLSLIGANLANQVGEAGAEQQGDHMGTVIIDEEDNPNDLRVVGDSLARWSQSYYSTDKKTGVVTPRDLVVNAGVVYDRGTALLIARDKLLQYAVPRPAIRVQGGSELDALDLNAVVPYTDARLHIYREPVVVRSKTIAGREVSLDLLLLDDPLTGTVSTV